jgi:uncharacterized protein (TIGR03435 family)
LIRNGETSTAACIPISLFVVTLAAQLGTEVSDKTGLSGLWDFEITYSGQSLDAVGNTGAADPAAAPSIFTALPEQLGLRLESSRAPIDVLAIDSVERPTEN